MRIVPAINGWQWIRHGLAIFAKHPIGWMTMVLAYWVLMVMSNVVPYIGPLAATLVLPAFSVSFMVISRELDAGRRLEPMLLFAGFRRNLPVLVTLGGIYLASIFVLLATVSLVDGGVLAKWVLLGEVPDQAAAQARRVLTAASLALVLYTPLLMAFWFAPVLSAWEDMSAVKALFYSFFAVLRNWRAFLVYSLALAGLALPVMVLFSVLFRAGESLGGQAVIGALLAIPVLLGGASIVLASFYSSYRSVFPPEPPEPAEALPSD